MRATDIGILMGCAEHGVNPSALPFSHGISEVMRDASVAAPVGRLLTKVAHAAMCVSGRKHTAAAYHLDLVSKKAQWDPHCQEVVGDVIDALMATEPMGKQAFAEALSGLGAGAKALTYGSVGAGGSLGVLYWLLSRHANQDSADIETMKQQRDYYDELGRELEDSMKRKYRYDRPVTN